ncbi:hypothetical protein [Aureimonas sp. AU40]|uniref:hypothetical protein n=1 Tax=Aureimonas sp. AU40 TaxID=1637747 RepID=UPI000785185C|nr:hypothetical protein [Aureimonas sp. AU40]
MSGIARKHRTVSLKKRGQALVRQLEEQDRRAAEERTRQMDELYGPKGEKGGRCNRTACQRPLKGSSNWSMRNFMVEGGRLYYCDPCAEDFTAWDKRSGDPIRCEIIEADRVDP